ncbi:hypothetical protein D3C85_1686640 [compost metagenome]
MFMPRRCIHILNVAIDEIEFCVTTQVEPLCLAGQKHGLGIAPDRTPFIGFSGIPREGTLFEDEILAIGLPL